MSTFLVFLGLVFGVAAAVAVVVVAGTTLLNYVLRRTAPGSGALPSHYAGLINTSPGRFAGHCPRCNTNNGPKETFCSNCSTRLPNSRRNRRSDTPNEHLLE